MNNAYLDDNNRAISCAALVPGKKLLNIDFRELEKWGFLSPFAPRSRVAEEFRAIKRPLLKNAFGQGIVKIRRGNLVQISSSSPGEGKTFNALNLALSISMEKDKTVLLIDADIVKPALSRTLALDQERGLVDYLLDDDLAMGEVLFSTNVPNLSIIPAGQSYERSTELLASNDMRDFVKEVADRYPDRIILMDSPPLLITNEACVLAELVGQVVMVVESGETLKMDVHDAMQKLPGDAHVSFILNKSKHSQAVSYYYGS